MRKEQLLANIDEPCHIAVRSLALQRARQQKAEAEHGLEAAHPARVSIPAESKTWILRGVQDDNTLITTSREYSPTPLQNSSRWNTPDGVLGAVKLAGDAATYGESLRRLGQAQMEQLPAWSRSQYTSSQCMLSGIFGSVEPVEEPCGNHPCENNVDGYDIADASAENAWYTDIDAGDAWQEMDAIYSQTQVLATQMLRLAAKLANPPAHTNEHKIWSELDDKIKQWQSLSEDIHKSFKSSSNASFEGI